MELPYFHNLHTGQTALIVGNGDNLKLTPPEWFEYPSFGLNTCHLWRGGWKPTYYTAVDMRVPREFGEAIEKAFADVPKFIPAPQLDRWQGRNFVRFFHQRGSLWKANRDGLFPSGFLTGGSVAYANVAHVAMQLALFMGFTRILMIGVHHKPGKAQQHFWGVDRGANATPPIDTWFEGYRILTEGLKGCGVEVLNISEDTYAPDDVLPRGNWRDWTSKAESKRTALDKLSAWERDMFPGTMVMD